MSTSNFKYDIGAVVMVFGVECKIVERTSWSTGENDYLCEPVDSTAIIPGGNQLGPAWTFEKEIEAPHDA